MQQQSSRRLFLKKTALTGAATYISTLGMSATSYRRIKGANDRVNVGVVGFSDRHKDAHIPAFLASSKELNFDIIAVSDIWKYKRELGQATLKERWGMI